MRPVNAAARFRRILCRWELRGSRPLMSQESQTVESTALSGLGSLHYFTRTLARFENEASISSSVFPLVSGTRKNEKIKAATQKAP